jgi:hypothetical protein
MNTPVRTRKSTMDLRTNLWNTPVQTRKRSRKATQLKQKEGFGILQPTVYIGVGTYQSLL